MTRPTDPLFDRRIADWLEDDPRRAPGLVLDNVLAALPSIPQRREMRMPWGFRGTPMLARLAAAAVIGALAVGGTFYLIHRGQPVVIGGPSPTPGLSAGPSESASPFAVPTPTVIPARAPSWTATGKMLTPRAGFSATLLLDGKVLVAGGSGLVEGGNLASAELYDPGTGSWTATGSMATPRSRFSATLLPNGKVLVAGGAPVEGGPLASAELYDPGSGTWSRTGSMATPRVDFTATLLPNGKVLVAGGSSDSNADLAAAELYDPGSGTWSRTGSMATPRVDFTATLLPNGKVLVAGGSRQTPTGGPVLGSAELYDPANGTWTATGSMATPRVGFSATLLPNGRVLVPGGGFGNGANTDIMASELYDPGSGTWTETGTMVTTGFGGTATQLRDGKVLVAGGFDMKVAGVFGGRAPYLASAELYDPANGSWTATASMLQPSADPTATLLRDGRVLVMISNSADLASVELYDPGSEQSLVPPEASPAASPSALPVPSPTSRPAVMVAFIRFVERANPMAETGRVWIVRTDGSGAHELVPGGVGVQSGVAWSPDGTRLIYSEGGKLYLTDASGSAPQVVDPGCVSSCSDTSAAFSPDGTRLVFERNGGFGGIATMDLASGRVVELSSTAAGYSERPRWSPDGKQIVFSRLDKFGNGSAAFVVDADGQNLHQLSLATLPARLPEWSPDDSRIVFTSLVVTYVQQGGTTVQKMSQDVYTVRPDWTDLHRLTTNGNSIGATWTPDGRILFSTGCQGDCAATGGLWVMNADGSNARLLVPGGNGLDAPLMGIDAAWQPTP